MKRLNILYWVFTVPFLAMMLFSAVGGFINPEESHKFIVEGMHYPAYIIPFLNVAKILGVAALLIPGMNRLKEWAYAGLLFDLVGATYSFIALGSSVPEWAPMLIFIGFGIGSYIYHHKRLELKKALSNSLR